ncbi:MAG: hypothetical protein KAK00_08945 [Nanoarchaeota archaeon]|nr:hypothetical protein [Nanoarchaeota archaeon]
MEKNQIISEIKNYVSRHGGIYQEWYVGISEDPKERLFNGHNVDKDNDLWIHREANSSEVAREIEEYFLSIGTKGGSGGGDSDAKYVYAYKINSHTKE